MAATWPDWATPAGTTVGDYDFLILAWLALDEKHKAFGGRYPSEYPTVWDSGIVQAVEQQSDGNIKFTLPVSPVWYPPGPPCYTPEQLRWVNYTPVSGGNSGCKCPPTYIPSTYDIVVELDDLDTRTSCRGRVIAQVNNSTTGQLTVDGRAIRDLLTAKFIPSLATLVGKRFVLIKSGRVYRLDRMPDRPNDPELWLDTAAAVETAQWPPLADPPSGPTYTVIRLQKSNVWEFDRWAGMELIVNAAEGLRRLPILHNDDNGLYVAQQAGVGTGPFAIVTPGKKSDPNRVPWDWTKWYYGSSIYAAAHTPDDVLSVARRPNYNERWDEGNPCNGVECEEQGHGVFDIDYHMPWDFEALCFAGRADDLINPYLHKSFRQLQKEIAKIAPRFIKRGWQPGQGMPNIYTDATLYADAAINNGVSTVRWQPPQGSGDTATSGYYYFNAQAKFVGKTLYYTTRTAKGWNDISGQAGVGSDARVQIGYPNYAPPDNANASNSPVGRAVIYSAGRSRFRPRWFKYHRELTAFVPDPKPKDKGGGVYDPPSVDVDENGNYDCDGKGTWITRGASIGGVVVDEMGNPLDSAEPFVVGEFYRCIGDNFADFPGGDTDDPVNPYYDRFYRGRLQKDHQRLRDASRVGEATAGNAYSLTDTTKNWTADHTSPGGSIRIESGTASAGTATTLTDASKKTLNPKLPWSCWYDPIRYAAGPYVGFILEVDHAGTTAKVPVTGFDNLGPGGVRFTFAAVDGFTVHAGDAWRIVEPKYELNRWKGCPCVITKGDGSTVTVTVTNNDANTLFFDALPYAVEEGWHFAIEERSYGGIWRWTGTEMVQAEGLDHVRVGVQVPEPFHDNPTENRESFVKDYGWLRYGDCVDCVPFFRETFDTLNLLKDWRKDMAWIPKLDPNDSEYVPNAAAKGQFGFDVDNGSHTDFQHAFFATQWDKDQATAANGGDWTRSGNPVWNASYWNDSYQAAKAIYDTYQPEQFESTEEPNYNKVPSKQYRLESYVAMSSGLDASGRYRIEPWKYGGGSGLTTAGFAVGYFGKAANVPRVLPASVDMVFYCTIDKEDHDAGATTVGPVNGTEPGTGFPTHNTSSNDYVFDSGNTAAKFREWAIYAGGLSIDTDGSVTGPFCGDISLDGVKLPASYDVPPGTQSGIAAMPQGEIGGWGWNRNQVSGYYTADQAVIIRPTMQYIV